MDVQTLLRTPPWEWPREAERVILKTLADKQNSESDRLIAAELGGDLVVMNDDLADTLMAVVASGEEPVELRARAAISLGPVLEEADLNEFDEPDDVPISESTFNRIQDLLHNVYLETSNPKEVRRKALEAAVRSPQYWQFDAIKTAYVSGDSEWMLTAVFAMRWVPGFDDRILEALNNPDPLIHYQAIRAAAARELEGAWSHVVALARSPAAPKELRLAAIEAVGSIRPKEAGEILGDLLDSRDEEIAAAAEEAIAMAQAMSGEFEEDVENDEHEEEENGGEWVN